MTLRRDKVTIVGKDRGSDSTEMNDSSEIPVPVVVAEKAPAARRRRPETLRWAACLAGALGIHTAGAAVLLGWGEVPDPVANAPVIIIELATLPVAPDTKPTEAPPGPPQPHSETASEPVKPSEKTVELPPAPQAEPLPTAVPPLKPVDKQAEKKSRQKHASLASLPSAAERHDARAAAPGPGVASHNPTRYRTGNRSWWHGLSASSAIRPRPRRAASRALRNWRSTSTVAAACTTCALCAVRARACSTRRRCHCRDGPRRCRRRRRN